ncbi:TfuA-related McrA-glycine thioamidation protein [Methanimicrococcus hongohii]|nr:TfuA-related McrA-glycine thioamidation protein [Methanimicrococcus sp. Hf6]
MKSQSIIVFLGPSLDLETARRILPSADFRPPASRGDLEKAVAENPDIICLIDGVFFEQCSVGHREILSALNKGIFVVGASSMGALRASETESFGMVGIGKVFELYKNKIVESDDEVAVTCDPFTNEAITEALVNIRATLEKAVSASILTVDESANLFQIAAEMYYPDRIYDFLIEKAREDDSFDDDHLNIFEKWIAEGNAADIKKEDAIAVLKFISAEIQEESN